MPQYRILTHQFRHSGHPQREPGYLAAAAFICSSVRAESQAFSDAMAPLNRSDPCSASASYFIASGADATGFATTGSGRKSGSSFHWMFFLPSWVP